MVYHYSHATANPEMLLELWIGESRTSPKILERGGVIFESQERAEINNIHYFCFYND